MKCLETRRREDGTKWRRYRADDGAIVKTVEVPAELWDSLTRCGRAKDRTAQRERVVQREAVRRAALALVNDGWKPLAVSAHMNLPLRTVHSWAA